MANNRRGSFFNNSDENESKTSSSDNADNYRLMSSTQASIDSDLANIADPKQKTKYLRQKLNDALQDLDEVMRFTQELRTKQTPLFQAIDNEFASLQIPQDISAVITEFFGKVSTLQHEINALKNMCDVAEEKANRRGGGP